MKKKLFMLLTFILSFIIYIGSVYAEDEDYNRFACLYKDAKQKNAYYALLVRNSNGTLQIYKSNERNGLYSRENLLNDNIVLYEKNSDGNLSLSNTSAQSKVNKENSCPQYIASSIDNSGSSVYIISYDGNKTGNLVSFNYELISSNTSELLGSTSSKDITCIYPATDGIQDEIVIEQKNGKISVTYGGKAGEYNLANKDNSTGYSETSGLFDSCPPCANKVALKKKITFSNVGSNNICPNSYSSQKSDDTNWLHTCEYGSNKDASLKIKLNLNKTNFEIVGVGGSHGDIIYKFPASSLWAVVEETGKCPANLYSKYEDNPEGGGTGIKETFFLKKKGNRVYVRLTDEGNEDPGDNQQGGEVNPTDCTSLLGDAIDIVDTLMKYIRIIIPILLLIFGITDFFSAVFSGNEDDMLKRRNKFFKRIIAAVIAFIVPTFVSLALGLANQVWPEISKDTCVK